MWGGQEAYPDGLGTAEGRSHRPGICTYLLSAYHLGTFPYLLGLRNTHQVGGCCQNVQHNLMSSSPWKLSCNQLAQAVLCTGGREPSLPCSPTLQHGGLQWSFQQDYATCLGWRVERAFNPDL